MKANRSKFLIEEDETDYILARQLFFVFGYHLAWIYSYKEGSPLQARLDEEDRKDTEEGEQFVGQLS